MNNIIIIGSGNVATHLALSLVSCGYKITQIWSQKIENAKKLSKKINSHAIDNLMDIKNDSTEYKWFLEFDDWVKKEKN